MRVKNLFLFVLFFNQYTIFAQQKSISLDNEGLNNRYREMLLTSKDKSFEGAQFSLYEDLKTKNPKLLSKNEKLFMKRMSIVDAAQQRAIQMQMDIARKRGEEVELENKKNLKSSAKETKVDNIIIYRDIAYGVLILFLLLVILRLKLKKSK